MKKYTNKVITEGHNNTGMVRYCVVDRTNTPYAICGGSFITKKEGIEQLQRAKHLYPNHNWTLEAVYSIGGKEKARKNLGDPLKESVNAVEIGTDEEFDAFMNWAMTEGSDMFSIAANEYVNGGNENKLRTVSSRYANEFGLNQEVAFSIAKEAAEGLYDFLGGFQVTNTKNTNESKHMNKKLIRLTEQDLHRIVKESVNKVLKESSDSVSVQPFGRTEDDYNYPNDEDISKGNEYDGKYRPWVDNPNCTDLQSSITWASHALSRWVESDPYIYQRFIEDMDAWYC